MFPDSEKDIALRSQDTDEEIGLFDLLLVLAKKKTMIFRLCAATFILACGITLLMPNIYTATARVMPPQQERGGLPAMLGGIGDLAALAGLSAAGGSADLYVGMLKSRTVADAVIDRFQLMEVYHSKTRQGAYDSLDKHVEIDLGKKDGIVAINVDDTESERAAAIANAFVEELKRLNVELNLGNASREKVFFAQRLEEVRKDLTRAEEALKRFQEENKAIKIDDQAKAIIESISQLKGELASKEVELGVLLSFQTEQNPQVRTLREAIGQLKGQLRKLEQSPEGSRVSDDSFIPTSDVPGLGLQYARLLRDFKVQEALFEQITRQYEISRINEAKEVSSIQVLDHATAPDRKSRPKRSLLVLGATVVAFVLAVFLAFALEYVERMPEAERRRWHEIRMQIPILGRRKSR